MNDTIKELKMIFIEPFEEMAWEIKTKYLSWILIAAVLIAMAYGSTMACHYLNNGQPCQMILPKV